MSPLRRSLLLASAAAAGGLGVRGRAAAAAESTSSIQRGYRLDFPRDHGAHLQARTEWWYATGWMAADATRPAQPTHGFQVTFFRSKTQATQATEGTHTTETTQAASHAPTPPAPPATSAQSAQSAQSAPSAQPARPAQPVQPAPSVPTVPAVPPATSAPAARSTDNSRLPLAPADRAPGRFAARHLLFAHAAITDLAAGRHHHAQRIARWNGEPDSGPDRALIGDTALTLARWHLVREGPLVSSTWRTQLRAEGLALRATMRGTQPTLLQGEGGFSRKGPEEVQASHYYSVPQLAVQLELELHGQRVSGAGAAWLDHEWSDALLHPLAVGWDWIGFNLFDGSALTAFRLRRADGSTLWAGGSWRTAAAAAQPARRFAPGEVLFTPARRWRSAATNADYPVHWRVHTPAGQHHVRALLDAQELDSRGSTGAVYWEGLSELLDAEGRRVGLGYLEMTGYAAPIKLG